MGKLPYEFSLTKITAVFALLLVSLLVSDCLAESYVQGIRVTCTSQRFEIASYTPEGSSSVSVVKVGNGETIYYGFKNHDVTCRFGNHIARATFNTYEPEARGQCGARPGSRASLWLDGKIVMHEYFNNGCYESLNTASFEDKKGIGLVFEICGHTGYPDYQEDCFVFQNEEFKSLSKPLPSFPISEFRKKRPSQKK